MEVEVFDKTVQVIETIQVEFRIVYILFVHYGYWHEIHGHDYMDY